MEKRLCGLVVPSGRYLKGNVLSPEEERIVESFMANNRHRELGPRSQKIYEHYLNDYGEDDAWWFRTVALNDTVKVTLNPTTRTPDGVTVHLYENPFGGWTVLARCFDDMDEARWLLENCYGVRCEDDIMFHRPTFSAERFDPDTLPMRFHPAPPPLPTV